MNASAGWSRVCKAAWAAGVLVLPAAAAESDSLPDGFVHLRKLAPSIEQTIRYATTDNFTSRPVPGYETGECVLIRPAAEALARVQANLEKEGLLLRVYDCYRPARAVRAFVDWARAAVDTRDARRYHPRLTKKELLAKRYIAEVSGHSLGIAVDLTLVERKGGDTAVVPETASHSGGCRRPSDGSVDMGTEFDCFDAASHVAATGLSSDQRRWRSMLTTVMQRHGFKGYEKEWWHFTWQGKAAEVRYDFPIRTLPAPQEESPTGPQP